jgi:hypothetical protein
MNPEKVLEQQKGQPCGCPFYLIGFALPIVAKAEAKYPVVGRAYFVIFFSNSKNPFLRALVRPHCAGMLW